MTGPGCFIIINCGLPKGAANGLYAMYMHGNVGMRAAAAELRDRLDEVCRFGETIAIAAVPLDEDDVQAIYALDGKQLDADIVKYLRAHADDETYEDLDAKGVALRKRVTK